MDVVYLGGGCGGVGLNGEALADGCGGVDAGVTGLGCREGAGAGGNEGNLVKLIVAGVDGATGGGVAGDRDSQS